MNVPFVWNFASQFRSALKFMRGLAPRSSEACKLQSNSRPCCRWELNYKVSSVLISRTRSTKTQLSQVISFETELKVCTTRQSSFSLIGFKFYRFCRFYRVTREMYPKLCFCPSSSYVSHGYVNVWREFSRWMCYFSQQMCNISCFLLLD